MAWIITKDLFDTDQGTEVGVFGPRGVSETAVASLKAGDGFKFRMLDDDGEVYYHGLPNAGCTDIQYRGRGGGWTSL
jgi:hypothetical protein